MRDIGAAATAIAGIKFRRFIAHGNAKGAGRHVYMLDRAGRVGVGLAQGCGRRDLKAHEVDAAAFSQRWQAIKAAR